MSDRLRPVRGVLLGGDLDLLLSAVLALVSLALGPQVSPPGALILDVAMCLAAAATTRWPRAGGVILGLLLLGYFFLPAGALALGQYAPMIPILGTGIRGQRPIRRWMTVGYGGILVALQYRDYPGSMLFLFGGLVWAALIGVLWLIGNTFSALRQAQAEAQAAALVYQRLALSRELHDTVARDLSRASLRAQLAQQSLDSTEIGAVVSEIQDALRQLRLMMTLLRDPEYGTASQNDDIRSPAEVLRDATRTLDVSGFRVAQSIQGALESIPPEIWPVFGAVVGEAVSNIERHGSAIAPCTLIFSIERQSVDMMFVNETAESYRRGTHSHDAAIGLLGVRERLIPIGGELNTLQEPSKWTTHVRIPWG